MAYLYRHVRLDKNEPFYIGIGSDDDHKRAFSSKQRNSYWNYITSKTDYKVQILFDDISWEEACKKEREFITIYGRKDLNKGSLCNMTEGGEGTYGRILSEESKNKIRTSVSGTKHGMYGKNHTSEAVRKISESQYKKVINPKTGIIYNSVQEAASILGIRANTLSRKLAGIRTNDTGLKYLTYGVV